MVYISSGMIPGFNRSSITKRCFFVFYSKFYLLRLSVAQWFTFLASQIHFFCWSLSPVHRNATSNYGYWCYAFLEVTTQFWWVSTQCGSSVLSSHDASSSFRSPFQSAFTKASFRFWALHSNLPFGDMILSLGPKNSDGKALLNSRASELLLYHTSWIASAWCSVFCLVRICFFI